MAKVKQKRSAATAPVLMVGVVLYLVSWLVPVFQGQQLFGSMGELAQLFERHSTSTTSALSGPEWLPGWAACHMAWNLLTEQQAYGGADWKRIIVGATCLTNVTMLAALVALACGARPRVLGALLLACAGLNASWIYLGAEDITKALRAGYYLWAGSFVLTGIGLLMPGGRESRS